ncbi:MAG: methylenetetrahydrofolate reductase [NAD(P)H] [Candidatus Omnitrophica bacterium]|nr:methylenetetrahydrofolate reductase [NAD(P)H] [Candidatus Omnitrophota bacterium]
MKIIDVLNRQALSFSLEFYPPKTDKGLESLYSAIGELKGIGPAFASVTYGAGGGTRDRTIDIATEIKRRFGIEVMAHLTCIGADWQDITRILDELEGRDIENILALRGDPPEGMTTFVAPPDGFNHANELVYFIRHCNDNFSVAVAGYPEGHIAAPDRETDWRYLKQKVDAGADFIITQLFFDNQDFFAFERRLRQLGVTVPILPGIMPITELKRALRIIEMSQVHIPDALSRALEERKEDPGAVYSYGLRYATDQIKELIQRGVKGIHFYTLNSPDATRAIYHTLKAEGVIA